MSGPVAKGFQRGSAKLGFPTANLPCSLFQDALANLDTGVYVGWAGLRSEVRKCVCNVGFSPSFVGSENPEKILEAHLIAGGQEVPKDFYGEPLRILLLGYIRPERRFDFSNGPGELIAAITRDVATASAALDAPPMSEYRRAPWLVGKGEEPTFELMDPDSVR
jgi:riboflavin kinase